MASFAQEAEIAVSAARIFRIFKIDFLAKFSNFPQNFRPLIIVLF
jgi:hypothetical protein